MYGYGPGMGWWMIVMTLLWVGLIAAVVWAVVRLLPDRSGRDRGEPHRESPREILDRRFASGEIDAVAYDEARARLAEARPEAQPRSR